MIGYPCYDNQDISLAFNNIDDEIIILKDALGNAYLPE